MIHWFNSLCALTLTSAGILADENLLLQTEEISSHQAEESVPQQTLEKERCKGPHHRWASVRYTTPEGIGYKNGYTTLEGFFTPRNLPKDAWIPFLDLRGHVFDNGKLAANAGLGLRYLARSRVWGVNAYYDYRNTERQHYNQVAVGLESLGRVWDFRMNGYLPVGRKQSPFSHPKFVAFEEHAMLIKRKRNFAMKGANAEMGVHVDHFENAPLYFAAGPYYLTGVGASTWGGELRGAVDLFRRYLRIEGNVSYDHFFGWVGQAQASINIPFGRRWKVEKKEDRSCSKMATLYARAMQRVDRYEIIPVGKQKVTSRAIDPATGKPWFFWFVDNTSSSAGTFEDPFPTLLAAQNASLPNQGIYVFPGDGTTRGMNSGITLQNGQIFLGAGVQQSVVTAAGTVVVPPLASSSPNITNTAGNIVTLANNNAVSGFNVLVQHGYGLVGTGISNLFAGQNAFIASNPNFDGINLVNPSGQVFISDSSFTGFSCTNIGHHGNGIYLELDAGSMLASLSITGNSLSHFIEINGNGGNGVFLNMNGGALGAAIISDNAFNNFSHFSMSIYVVVNGTLDNLNISSCSFNNISQTSAIFISTDSGILDNLNISDCLFTNFSVSSAINASVDGVINHFNVSNNAFENLSSSSMGVVFQLALNPIKDLSVSGNSFYNLNSSSTAIFYHLFSPESASLQVLDNTFIGGNNEVSGYAADIQTSGSLCLEFIGNSATPASSPTPYFFANSGGTFNRTTGSDNTTNIGQFQLTDVNPPGSCP